MTYYANVDFLRKYYREKYEGYIQMAESLLQPTDDRYLQLQETRLRDSGNMKEALKINDKRLALAVPGSHQYAIVTFYRAIIYKVYNRTEDARQLSPPFSYQRCEVGCDGPRFALGTSQSAGCGC